MLYQPHRLLIPQSPGIASAANSFNIVNYNGTNQYLRKSTNFGSYAQYSATLSMWFRLDTVAITGTRYLFASGGWLNGSGDTPFAIVVGVVPQSTATNSRFRIFASGNYNNDDYGGLTSPASFSGVTGFNYDRDKWVHFIIGFSADSYANVIINDVDSFNWLQNSNPISFFSDTNNTTVAAVENAASPGSFVGQFPGKIAETWFSTNIEIDPTNTSFRRNFITAGLTPATFPANGSIPLYGAPEIYLPKPAATVQENGGTSGNFTKVGSPTGSTGAIIVGGA